MKYFFKKVKFLDNIKQKRLSMSNTKQGYKLYLEEHSRIKIDFYKKYLDIYLTVLINSKYTTKIKIYDLFCGVGIYKEDGNKGSPIVAIESIKSKLEKFGKKNINSIDLIINDGDINQVNIASEYIEKNYPKVCGFEKHNMDAKDMLIFLKEQLSKSVKSQNNLIFIDPHGYKQIYKSDISDIMNLGKNEILIFLPIHFMYRFLNPAKKDEENPSYKALKRFMNEFELNYNVNSVEQYIEFIREAFTYNDQYYSTSFMLESENKNKYALFFLTKNMKGLEESVKIKWKLDDICGKAHYKKNDMGLLNDVIKEEEKKNCLKYFKDELKEFLKEYRTNNDLYLFVLKKGLLVKYANDILKEFVKDGKLNFNKKVRKNSFYMNYENYRKKEIKYKVKIVE